MRTIYFKTEFWETVKNPGFFLKKKKKVLFFIIEKHDALHRDFTVALCDSE